MKYLLDSAAMKKIDEYSNKIIRNFHFEKYNLGWILLLSLMIVVGCSLVDKLRLYIQNKFINL